jgi:chromate reductase, NAD(P)H dehydrogenase (quinone)
LEGLIVTNNPMNILAISGSLRSESSNTAILRFMQTLAPDNVHVAFYEGITNLPHFNTDLDNDTPPEAVTYWRQALKSADGITICTPEYAHGVPGSLKNTLDWIVSSGEWIHKPTAVITASLMGDQAHASLLSTLTMLMAAIIPEATFVIPSVSQKLDKTSGVVTDPDTVNKLRVALQAIEQAIRLPIV